jgi:hypothetical protein
MWSAAERHPVRALLLFALSGLVVVDGARRTLVGDGTPARAAPQIACTILALGAVPMSVFIRARPEFTGQRTQLLLAVAFTPIVLAVAAAAFGANSWLLWAFLALAVALSAWWATDGRSRHDGQPPAAEQLDGRRSC